jgi:DNA polymerase-3 subunit alpha
MRVLQVATFGTEGTKSAILTACRGYRSEEYPNGIDVDDAQYIASLIPQERGFLWSLDDVTKGNPDKDRKPIAQFNSEMEKYPGLLEIIYGIDGLVNKRSQHASGVILYNDDPWLNCAVMRSPNGDLTTQFDLHRSEAMGNTKFDFLVTDICDKLTEAIKLLVNDGYFSECESLREIYNKYLHPDVLDLKDEKIWDKLDY